MDMATDDTRIPFPELKRRLALLGPAHEAINTTSLALATPVEFDKFVKDVHNLARVYRDDSLDASGDD
jgi:hypothetical protein